MPGLPGILLHTAVPGSGLSRLLDTRTGAEPPYWAYPWAGGLVLARFFGEHPQAVAGRSVLDLGAGSGLVGIAAAKAGAAQIVAAEIDPLAVVALKLNAAANGIALTLLKGDPLDGAPPPVDLVAVGDLFYSPLLGVRVTAFLDRCLAIGAKVLIGDPYREHLPHARLKLLVEYEVSDVGDRRSGTGRRGAVFSFEPLRY